MNAVDADEMQVGGYRQSIGRSVCRMLSVDMQQGRGCSASFAGGRAVQLTCDVEGKAAD